MDMLVAAFLAWIVGKTGLAMPEPPRIVLLPKAAMVAMYYGEDRKEGHFQLEAFYVHSDATVYLTDSWRAADSGDQSVLLHELVHHVQWRNGVKAACRAALERQAYELQVAWLREQGVKDAHEVAGIDEFSLRILTSCPGEE